MQIFLDSFGASLFVRNKMFAVKPKDKPERLFAVAQVKAFFVTKGIHLSSDALLLALENDIPIVLLNSIGHPVGQVWSGRFGSISTIRRQQLAWSQHKDGVVWFCGIINLKIERQITHLNRLAAQIKGNDAFRMSLQRNIAALERQKMLITTFQPHHLQSHNDDLMQMRGIEGNASAAYFKAIAKALPPKFSFKERSRQPALDPFNAALNYAYGVLYAMVELALIKAGLDPAIAVMHIDRHQRPTMVFDCIEPYRAWADEAVVDLFLSNKLTENDFTNDEIRGCRLSANAKQVLVQTFLEHLSQPLLYTDNQLRKRATHIDFDAIRLASFLKNANYAN